MVGLSGCAPPAPPLGCEAISASAHTVVTLYFGRAVRGRENVSDAEWREFLERSITPNLPDGYTVLDATGAWMNPLSHITIHEATKVLVVARPLLGPDAAGALQPIERIRRDYRERFNQLSVGMTAQAGCGAF
jgi:hypothetical protein